MIERVMPTQEGRGGRVVWATPVAPVAVVRDYGAVPEDHGTDHGPHVVLGPVAEEDALGPTPALWTQL